MAIVDEVTIAALEGATRFPDDLRLLKKALGIGTRELARQLGVSAACLSYWENGKHPPADGYITLKVYLWAERLRNAA